MQPIELPAKTIDAIIMIGYKVADCNDPTGSTKRVGRSGL